MKEGRERRREREKALLFNYAESVLEHHNYVFWCGDMNYRVDMSRQEVDQLLERNDLRVSDS